MADVWILARRLASKAAVVAVGGAGYAEIFRVAENERWRPITLRISKTSGDFNVDSTRISQDNAQSGYVIDAWTAAVSRQQNDYGQKWIWLNAADLLQVNVTDYVGAGSITCALLYEREFWTRRT